MADSEKSDARRVLVATRWVHVDGDDTPAGAVYRDEAGDIPLSRRPKEFLQFADDGSVRKLATGPDDRAHEVDRTTWSEEGGHVVFRFGAADAKGPTEYRVVERSGDRIVVRRQ
jgi:hypothetical protein